MPTPLRLLIVEDLPADAELLVLHLEGEGFQLEWQRVQTEADYLTALETNPDLILSDWLLPLFSGSRALQLMNERGLNIPFIIVSGSIGEETAVESMRQGAVDYLLKDRLRRLGQAVRHALEDNQLRQERRKAEADLRESEERFRSILDDIKDSYYYEVDIAGNFTFVSPALVQMLGRPANELMGMNNRLYMTPEGGKAIFQTFNRVFRTGIPERGLAWDLVRPDGTLRSADISVSLVKAANGSINGFRGTVHDITERKQAEQALRRSQEEAAHANRLLLALSQAAPAVQRARTTEEVYSAIQEQLTQMGYYATGLELTEDGSGLRIAYVNYKADLVRKAEKVTGLSLRDFRFRPRADSIYQRIIVKGETIFIKNVTQAVADTLPKKLRLLARPVADLLELDQTISAPLMVGEKTIGILSVTGSDLTEADNPAITAFANQAAIAIQNAQLYEQAQQEITERKQAEQALLENEQRLTSIHDTVGDVIFYLAVEPDGQYRFDSVNPAFCRVTGLPSGQVIGRKVNEIIPEPSLTMVLGKYRQAIAEKAIVRWEETSDYPTGRLIGEVSVAPVFDEAGNCTHLVGSVHDITERKRNDDLLLAQRNLLQTLIDSLPDNVFVKDVNGRIIVDNITHRRLLGATTLEQVVGKTDFDFFPKELADLYSADEKQIIQSGKPLNNREEPVVDKDQNQRWLLTTKVPLRDPQGMVTGIVGINHDITERKKADERIRRQLEHLTAMSVIDRVIASIFDLKLCLSEILAHVTKELGIDAADILILNPISQMLEYGAEYGFRTNAIRKTQVHLGESHAGRAALERHLVQIPNLRDEPGNLSLKTYLADEDFFCYYGVPLIAKGQVKGVLEVYHRTPLEPDAEWFDFLNTLAGQAAIAIENSTLFESLQRSNLDLSIAYDATIEGWSHALDLRDKETEGHSMRVTELTVELARLLGFGEAELVQVRWGALLHDIGKMGVPDGILLKPGPLTDEEWVAIKKHPTFAYEMLAPIRYLRMALDIPYCHHEQWDGSGYPRGLKGEQIPLSARIFAVVDMWDALTSDRPYRLAWTEEKARELIQAGAGTHFDPQVVKIFFSEHG
jgi:PAS domain S-box-containing protein/putative nucleotidyltransferase with HDIG domain